MKPKFKYLVGLLFLFLISPFSTCGHGFPCGMAFPCAEMGERVSIEVEHIAFYVGSLYSERLVNSA